MKYCVELSAGLDAAADYLYLDADDEYLPDTHPGVLLLFRPLMNICIVMAVAMTTVIRCIFHLCFHNSSQMNIIAVKFDLS